MRLYTRCLASASLALIMIQPATAANPGAAQALQILTRARVADDRCQFLSPSLHDELRRYSARAEIAAANQLSPSVASSAIAAGKAEGQVAPCNDTTSSEITDTLDAARQAVKRADAAAASPAPRASVSQAVSSPPVRDARPVGQPGSLARYAHLVGPYYMERKCRVLSPNQDDRYWRAITQIHQATVAANGYPAVRSLMHRAEVSAATRDCNGESLLMIKAGFAAALNG